MLILSRKTGESIVLGDDVFLTVLGFKGRQVSIGIDAPDALTIMRNELYQKKSEFEKQNYFLSSLRKYFPKMQNSNNYFLNRRYKMSLTLFKDNVLNSLNSNLGKIFIVVCLLIMAHGSFAADALAGAEDVVKDTYNGSIKTYLYIGEAIGSRGYLDVYTKY